jgi:hypothetical protein
MGNWFTGRIRRYSERVTIALESDGRHVGMRDREAVFDVASPDRPDVPIAPTVTSVIQRGS